MDAEGLNVDALVADLRREAGELRRRLDPNGTASSSRPNRGSATPQATQAGLERLRELADPRPAALQSHRGRMGTLVLTAKRVLIRLLTPIWDQQTLFDRAAVGAIENLDRTVAALAWENADLERRLLRIEDALDRIAPAGATEPAFDYDRFEARFRGGERVRQSQASYLEYFREPGSGPVLDLGCGEGTFLHLLRERGVPAWGVERGSAAAARARADGLDVREGDLLDGLAACADGSLGGVVSFQVVEHLSLPAVLRLIQLARRKLRHGGCFIAETVNLASLSVFTRGWTIDPTHRLPLHPLTLRFLVDEAGFTRSELVYSGEVEPEKRLDGGGADTRTARNVEILNELLFGSQDCAVVAWS